MKTMHILLLTDDPEVGVIVDAAAQACGAELSVSPTKAEELEHFDSSADDADLILIDLEPAAQQVALMVSLRRRRPKVPVVVFAEEGEHLVECVARADGATQCVEKPLTAEMVRSVIERFAGAAPAAGPSANLSV